MNKYVIHHSDTGKVFKVAFGERCQLEEDGMHYIYKDEFSDDWSDCFPPGYYITAEYSVQKSSRHGMIIWPADNN